MFGLKESGVHLSFYWVNISWTSTLCCCTMVDIGCKGVNKTHGLTSLVAQTAKRLFTMRETRVQSLGREDPLEKEMAIHSSTIAWKIPWTEEPGRQRVGHDWATPLTLTHSQSSERILEWLSIPFSKGSSQLRHWTWVSCTASRFFMSEPPGKPQVEFSVKW